MLSYGKASAGGAGLSLVEVRVLEGERAGEEGWTEQRFLSSAVVAHRADEAEEGAGDADQGKPQKDYRLGQTLQVYNSKPSGPQVLIYTNERAFEDFLSVNDETRTEIRFSEMLASGKLIRLQEYTRVVFVESKKITTRGKAFTLARVRVSGGQYLGRTGLVIYQDLIE